MTLFDDIAACRVCAPFLPLGPRPVVQAADPAARVLIIGQAPGRKVHETGIAWDDASGRRLRDWMQVRADDFYDMAKFALMPMGFCYPGKGRGGDNPPRPECAPLWHGKIRAQLPHIGLTLLIGTYAHAAYLGAERQRTLGETVQQARLYAEKGFFPLVHPSPRNQIWLRKNPWFEADIVPELRRRLRALGV